MNNSHRMVLIEGSAVTKRRRYSYRGHILVQTYRNHDSRNSTHRGFDWHVEWAAGGVNFPITATRAGAKATIDRATDQPANIELHDAPAPN